jgi:mannonate dehydratase
MIKIGTRISADWLKQPDDLKFLQQIGVDCVDITLDICPGYLEAGGRANRSGLQQVAEAVDAAGLKVERANTSNRDYQKTFLGQPGHEQEIDNLIHNAELCAEFGFPVMGIQCFQATHFPGFPGLLKTWVEGRGGHQHLKMNLSAALDQPPAPGVPTSDELWDRTLSIFRAVVPVAESAGVKIAMHGNDPPVASLHGVPQVLYNYAAFDRLFAAVPSANNGMTFCVGTRYESGEDIFEGIKHFGEQGKIFHVHFRNVRGTIPADKQYEEMMPDLGDLNMYEVVRALHDVGYDAVIDYDHIMKLTTDSPQGRQYIAYCVGHMHGLLSALEAAEDSKNKDRGTTTDSTDKHR